MLRTRTVDSPLQESSEQTKEMSSKAPPILQPEVIKAEVAETIDSRECQNGENRSGEYSSSLQQKGRLCYKVLQHAG
jgi:hypothetical protein